MSDRRTAKELGLLCLAEFTAEVAGRILGIRDRAIHYDDEHDGEGVYGTLREAYRRSKRSDAASVPTGHEFAQKWMKPIMRAWYTDRLQAVPDPETIRKVAIPDWYRWLTLPPSELHDRHAHCVAALAAKHQRLDFTPPIAWVAPGVINGEAAGFVEGYRGDADIKIRLVADKLGDLKFCAFVVLHEVRHLTQRSWESSEAKERDATTYEREWGERFHLAAMAAKNDARRVKFSERVKPDWDDALERRSGDVVITRDGAFECQNGGWIRIAR